MPKAKRLYGVSDAELRVIRLIANGLHHAEVAKELGLRRYTIKTHLQRACGRMGALNAAHLVAMCFRQGILTDADILEKRAHVDGCAAAQVS